MFMQMQLRQGGERALALAFLAAVIEGFDLQAAGVAVPKLAPAFALTPQQIGFFLSSATFGLILGALAGGRIADVWGRRTGLVLSLVTFGIFSVLTVFVSTYEQLLIMRFLTGVGLGGAFPNMINIAAESVEPNYRGRAVAFVYAGVPLGGAVASGVSMLGLHGDDWHTIFFIGGLLPLALSPFVQTMLPQLNVLKNATSSASAALVKVFAPGTLMTTMTLWISFFLGLIVVYLLLNWMPQLLVSRGLTRGDAALVQILFNIGGIFGSVVGGQILDRENPRFSVGAAFAAAAVALVMLAVLPANLALMLIGGALVGATILCMQAILYAVAPQCYSFDVRGTGVGLAVAVGRAGSIAGPVLAGVLVASGSTPSDVMLALVPIVIVAGLATLVLLTQRSRNLVAA